MLDICSHFICLYAWGCLFKFFFLYCENGHKWEKVRNLIEFIIICNYCLNLFLDLITVRVHQRKACFPALS